MYQSSTTSQDGLAEAIQLLSCRPSRAYQPTLGQSFAEEQPIHSVSQPFLGRNGKHFENNNNEKKNNQLHLLFTL